MEKFFTSLIKNNFWLLWLFGLVLSIYIGNYNKGTILSGWDNLHPEFQFKEYFIDNVLFGVNQESYGLGSIISHAPYTELVRLPFYFILKLLVGAENVRYTWHVLLLGLGGLGFGKFLELLIKKRFNTVSLLNQQALLCLGVTFFILNVGTVQNFYVPYEPFSYFFAFFPWAMHSFLLLFITNVPQSRQYLKFLLIQLLGIPSFYIPTIFIVYMLLVGALLICLLLIKQLPFKRAVLIIMLILIANVSWLLPFSYFISSGKTFDVATAESNVVSSGDALVESQRFGGLNYVLRLHGFMFGVTDYDQDSINTSYVMQNLINHYYKFNVISTIMVGFFILGITGSFSLLQKKYACLGFLLTFICLSGLSAGRLPLGIPLHLLSKELPILSSLFRFSFTKFIVPTVFFYTIYIIIAVLFLYRLITYYNNKIQSSFLFIISVFLIAIILIYNFPIFRNNFFYSKMFVRIPNDYFSLSEFLNTHSNKHDKVANLPQPSFWGWHHYNWGYRGSGFFWYLINNPILDRAFDVHNKYLGQYYEELTYSLYNNSLTEFENVLKKYDIEWVWLDKNILFPENPKQLNIDNSLALLNSSKYLFLAYSNNTQLLYSVNFPKGNTVSEVIFSEGSDTSYYGMLDRIYSLIGNYLLAISSSQDKPNRIYLYNNLLEGFDFDLNNRLNFTKKIETAGTLNFPDFYKTQEMIKMQVRLEYKNGGLELSAKSLTPVIYVNDELHSIPSVTSSYTLQENISLDNTLLQINNHFYKLSDYVADVPILADFYTKQTNVVNLYDFASAENIVIDYKDISLDNCTDLSLELNKISYGKNNISDGFVLYGKGSRPCGHYSLENLSLPLNDNSVIGLSFVYDGLGSGTFELCIKSSPFLSTCDIKKGEYLNSNDANVATFFSGLEKTDTPVISFIINALGAEETEVSFHKLSLTLLNESSKKVSGNWMLFTNNTESDNLPYKLSVKSGDIVRIQTLPHNYYFSSSESTFPIIYPYLQFSTPVSNCATNKNGSVSKKLVTTEYGPYLEYTSKNASICESHLLDYILYNPGQINIVDYANISGRGINYCILLNPSGFCLKNTILEAQSNTFSSSREITVIPPIDSKNTLGVYLQNSSRNSDDVRINRVGAIRFLPFPHVWLSSITLEAADTNNNISSLYTVSRVLPFIYTYDKNTVQKNAVLAIYQSFDDGWLALCGYKRCPSEHHILNGWANGWLFTSSYDGNVTVVFWPQLFEFFGLFITAAVTSFLFLKTNKQ